MSSNTNGRISTVEDLSFIAQCDLCESFVERRQRQTDALEALNDHLREHHHVRPQLMQFSKGPLFARVEEKPQ